MTHLPVPAEPVRTRSTRPGPVLVLAAALLLGGCASGSGGLAPVRAVSVPSLSGAIECAREQGKELGFESVQYDEADHLLVLERTDEDVRRSDPTFQRAVDQLTLEPGEGDASRDRPLEVTARTYFEYFTRRGRTRRQREASEGVRAAAGTLIERCAGGEAGGR